MAEIRDDVCAWRAFGAQDQKLLLHTYQKPAGGDGVVVLPDLRVAADCFHDRRRRQKLGDRAWGSEESLGQFFRKGVYVRGNKYEISVCHMYRHCLPARPSHIAIYIAVAVHIAIFITTDSQFWSSS